MEQNKSLFEEWESGVGLGRAWWAFASTQNRNRIRELQRTGQHLGLQLSLEDDDAVGPFTVKAATAAAFYTTPAEPDIHPSVIDYIASFMTEHSGKNFSPHVTIGVGTTAFLDAMLAEPFTEFTFSLASASVYQFGDFGAARKQLMALPANR
jgi:hypothetical protein